MNITSSENIQYYTQDRKKTLLNQTFRQPVLVY